MKLSEHPVYIQNWKRSKTVTLAVNLSQPYLLAQARYYNFIERMFTDLTRDNGSEIKLYYYMIGL